MKLYKTEVIEHKSGWCTELWELTEERKRWKYVGELNSCAELISGLDLMTMMTNGGRYSCFYSAKK